MGATGCSIHINASVNIRTLGTEGKCLSRSDLRFERTVKASQINDVGSPAPSGAREEVTNLSMCPLVL